MDDDHDVVSLAGTRNTVFFQALKLRGNIA